jgi:ribonuclease HI
MIRIYSDGGCRGNGNALNIGAWSAVILFPDKENPTEIVGAEANTTNQRMELMGVIEGLEAIDHVKDVEVTIYTDSSYIVNCMNEKWYMKWKRNGWKTKTREQVKNRDLWETLLVLMNSREGGLSFVHVKGHTGITWNERADKLVNILMDDIMERKEKKSA